MQKEVKKGVDFDKLKLIGQALKKLRKAKGYSNYHVLADKLKMAHSQYSAYESGMKNLTLNTLFRILDFHEISLKEFVNDFCEEKSN